MREPQRDLLIIGALLAVVIAGLSFGYVRPLELTMLLSITAATTLFSWRTRQDLALGLTGIVLGPAIEFAATSSGLWTYTMPSVATLPLWVVPMWWIYPVTVARLARAISGQRHRAGSVLPSLALMAIQVTWLCAFAGRDLISLIGTTVLLATLLFRHHARIDWITVIVCGAIGPIAEVIPVQMGAWAYASGPLFGLPWWLPAGYGVFGSALIHAGVSVSAQSGRKLHEPEPKQRVAGWQP